jgi:hypothetical protein
MAEKRKISLVLADVDGTLVTGEGPDQASAERRQCVAKRRHSLLHNQRSATARHGHAV